MKKLKLSQLTNSYKYLVASKCTPAGAKITLLKYSELLIMAMA